MGIYNYLSMYGLTCKQPVLSLSAVQGGGEKTVTEVAKLCPPRPKLEAGVAARGGRSDRKSYSTVLIATQNNTDNETENRYRGQDS